MQLLPLLCSPVPPEGRAMSQRERQHFKVLTGNTVDQVAALLAYHPDGKIRLKYDTVDTWQFTEKNPASTGVFACLIYPVPVEGRYLAQGETIHGRHAGLTCSVSTYVRPRPDGTISRWTREEGFAPTTTLTPYIYHRATPLIPEGHVSVGCLFDPVPPTGRDLTAREEKILRRLAPYIKYDSFFIIPAGPDAAMLLHCNYTGSYLLIAATGR